MAATLNHTQTRTANVPASPNAYPSVPVTTAAPYRVVDVVNASTGFPLSPAAEPVFVLKVADGLFDHVATVLDIQTFPTSLIAAQSANLPYYRQTTVYRDHTTMQLAQDFADTLVSRMTSLCNEYQITATTFVGVTGPVTIP